MKRKLATTIAVVFVLGLAALAQAPAAATKIAILDLQGAIMSTNEGQRDFAQLQKTFEPKKNELQTAGAEIEKLKTQLSSQEKLMNDEARAKLMKEIDTKQKQYQRTYEDATNDFSGQQNEIAGRIGTKLYEVVKKYAADNGYAVVLNANGGDQPGPVLWAAPTSDITKAVVDAYNAQSGVAAPSAAAAKPAAPAAKPAAPAAKKP